MSPTCDKNSTRLQAALNHYRHTPGGFNRTVVHSEGNDITAGSNLAVGAGAQNARRSQPVILAA